MLNLRAFESPPLPAQHPNYGVPTVPTHVEAGTTPYLVAPPPAFLVHPQQQASPERAFAAARPRPCPRGGEVWQGTPAVMTLVLRADRGDDRLSAVGPQLLLHDLLGPAGLRPTSRRRRWINLYPPVQCPPLHRRSARQHRPPDASTLRSRGSACLHQEVHRMV